MAVQLLFLALQRRQRLALWCRRFGAICDTAPRGMAQRYRLDRHPPHIRRCLYRRRRAFPDLAAASEPSVAASPAPSRPFPFEKPRRPLAFTLVAEIGDNATGQAT